MQEPSVLKVEKDETEDEEATEDTDETIETVTPAEIPGENEGLEFEENETTTE